METVEQTQCDGYTRFRYHIQSEGSGLLPAYVLIPDEGRRNGRTVIHPHGHDARRAYRAAAVEDRLDARVYDLAHQFHVDIAEEFFLKWL